MEYERTRGASRGKSGRRFELLLLMLAFLRSLGTGRLFFLGSSCSRAGKFDDVVLVWEAAAEGGCYAALVQAKYRKDRSALRLRQLVATKRRAPGTPSYPDYFLGNFQASYETVRPRWRRFQGRRLRGVLYVLLVNGTLRGEDFPAPCHSAGDHLEENILAIFGGTLTKLSASNVAGVARDEFLDSFRILSLGVTMDKLLKTVKREIGKYLGTDDAGTDDVYKRLRAEFKGYCEEPTGSYVSGDWGKWLEIVRLRLEAFSLKREAGDRDSREFTEEELREMVTALRAGGGRRVALVTRDLPLTLAKLRQGLRAAGQRGVEVAPERAAELAQLARAAACWLVLPAAGEDHVPEDLQQVVLVTAHRPEQGGWAVVEDATDREVVLQGRPTRLRDLSQECLDAASEVGAPLGALRCAHYVPRTVTRRRYLRTGFFGALRDAEICAVVGATATELARLLPGVRDVRRYRDLADDLGLSAVVCAMSRARSFAGLCERYPRRAAHLVQLRAGRWRWQRSRGDARTVRDWLEGDSEACSEEELADDAARSAVLEALPGMGASSLLRRLALRRHHASGDWVMILDLAALPSLQLRVAEDVVRLLQAAEGAGAVGPGTLGGAVLRQRLLHSGGLALFVDGVADVVPRYTDQLTRLLRFLVDETEVSKIVVATRPDATRIVEDAVHAAAFRLQALGDPDYSEHLQWLVRVHGAAAGHERWLLRRTLETPLLMGVAVEAAAQLGGEQVLRWYEEVHARLTTAYVAARQSGRHPGDPFLDDTAGAWARATRAELLGLVGGDPQPADSLKYSCKVGLLYSDPETGHTRFVHKGLADYFTALHLSGNLPAFRMALRKKPFTKKISNTHDLVNRLLCRGYQLHEAVLVEDARETEALLAQSTPKTWTDRGGRTPLHLSAIYGLQSVVRLLVARAPAMLRVKDEVQGWSPLQYAQAAAAKARLIAALTPEE